MLKSIKGKQMGNQAFRPPKAGIGYSGSTVNMPIKKQEKSF
jgi:hypothetical protein